MDIKKILKFLFPEYQVFEAIKEHGFIAKSGKSNNQINEMAYSGPANNNANASVQIPSINKNAESNNYKNFNEYKELNRKKELNKNEVLNKKKKPVPNKKFQRDLSNLDEDFNRVRKELSSVIIGQDSYLNNLVLAFKRPYVTGQNGSKPRNTIFVMGRESTGRRTSLEAIVKLLKERKFLSSEEITSIDLAIYPTNSEQSLFLSDVYKALYSDSEVILFESFEKGHSSIIDIISKLVIDGRYLLNKRYAFQDNNLIEATGVLMQKSVSELSANSKYFIFLTEKSEKEILEIFGSKFVSSVGDFLNIDPYTEEELIRITRGFLRELAIRCSDNLSIVLKYDNSLASYCAKEYTPSQGLRGIKRYIDELIYKALTEYKLRKSVPNNTVFELFIEGERLYARIVNEKFFREPEIIDLREMLPNRFVLPLDEVKKELDSVIGLKKVKDYVLSLEDNYKIQNLRQDRGYKVASVSMNMIFIGNPGTGKTTIARIIAKYLKALGVLSTGQLREVTRGDLVGQYVGHTAKLTNEVIQSALGGVLFIDEAYSLCRDKHDTFGLEAIDTLVKGIEDHRDNLVVIMAGYKEEMEEFLKVNTGLKSRFPNIIEFEDYTPEEMYEIALIIAKSKGYRIAENCKEHLIKLFERSQIRGRNDSGNGRLVRNCIEGAILEQSQRLTKDPNGEMDLLVYEDFNFQDFEKFNLEKELAGIIGLENVKEFVRTQHALLVANEKRRKAGINVDTTQSLNMVFTGNPGTGKTTIARLLSSMFKDMGLLKKGHLVETDRGGLVSEYVGQTVKKTEEVFRDALGGVLFIDEAYSLAREGDSFGKEAIDTLVKLMEDYRGEIVVILAGYKKEMSDFMKSNSGLESRFPLQIHFPDYNANELYEIALKMISTKGFFISEEAKPVLFDQISMLQKTSTAHSGNGRMVRNLIEKIMRNQSMRIASEDVPLTELTKILSQDIVVNQTNDSYDIDEALSKIIGLQEVKSFVKSLYARLKMQKERKKLGLPVDDSLTLHMIFKGNPGTGKTMVARAIANVLGNMGVIRTNKLIETDRSGLVGGYVGQTAIKTREKVMEALDGVLFIDEAYALAKGGPNDFGKEAVDTLVKLMDDYRERLVVILAGYSKDMDDFLKVNPGLKSRFPNIIEFADYTVDELMEIAQKFYQSKGYALSSSAEDKLRSILFEATQEEAFGNGRYVRNIFEKSVNNQALRLSTDLDLTREELIVIEAEDIEKV